MRILELLLNTDRRRRGDARQFGVLLALMGAWLVAMPLLEPGGGGIRILRVAFALIALQALIITARSTRERCLLALWALLLLVHPLLALSRDLAIASALMISALLLYIPVRLSAFVLEQPVVDRNSIFGALCAYLFMGLSFAVLYALIVELWPGAIHVPDGTAPDAVSWLYFSFTTLVTLGYGDIVPRAGAVRMLAILEALIGQIYLVVVMARLVSAGMAAPRKPV